MTQYIVIACVNRVRVHVRCGTSRPAQIMKRHRMAYAGSIALVHVENAHREIARVSQFLTERSSTRRHCQNTVVMDRTHTEVVCDVLSALDMPGDCEITWG